MNKYELACKVAKMSETPVSVTIPVVNAVFEAMADTILSDEKVIVNLLGSFSLKTRRQREGYDPSRGVHMTIPESKSLKFDPSPSMLRRIRERYEKQVVPEKNLVEA